MEKEKAKIMVRTKPEIFQELQRRALEEKKSVNQLVNKVLEKYVAESHQKWFEKDTQFVGRLWKKIEVEGVETRKDILDMSKAIMALVELFRGMDSTRQPMDEAMKKVCLEIDRINFLASGEEKKEG